MTHVIWEPDDFDVIGFLGGMLDEDDPRPAKEQFDANYQHGGGWQRFDGHTFGGLDNPSLKYPGDPVLYPVARAKLRDESIFLYPYSWVCIVQPNGDYEVARMD